MMCLITTGGVSVGDYDFTKPVLRELGAEIFFEKIALKPGKPTVFAKLNDCLIFGLPGNPVSVGGDVLFVCANGFAENAEREKLRIKTRFCRRRAEVKGRERTRFGFARVRRN